MKLIGSLTSPFVRKVRIVAADKHIDYQFVVDVPWEEETRVPDFNPLGKVPALKHGDSVITEVAAICAYLAASTALAANAGAHGMGFAVAAALPLVSALSTTPLLGARATVQSARAAWHRFMLLNVPMGAVASALLIASWQ